MNYRVRSAALVFLGLLVACAKGTEREDDLGGDEVADEPPRAIGSDSDDPTGSSNRDGGSVPIVGDSAKDGGATDASPPSVPPLNPPSGKKRAFVTSTKYVGNLGGGVAGADGKCTKSATVAMLGGTWKAWISDSAHDAEDRIAPVGPWYTVDGKTKMYDDVFDLITAPLANDASWLDELGNHMNEQLAVWTGTKHGKRTYSNCDDWSSQSSGSATAQYLATDDFLSNWSCSEDLRLLCIEQ